MSEPDLSANGLRSSDPLLKDADFAKFYQKASDEQIEATKKALEGKQYKVKVVHNKHEALEAVKSFLGKGESVYSAGSTTLHEIGYTNFIKDSKDYHNVNAEVLAEKDMAKSSEIRRLKGMTADNFLSSVCAITEDGSFTVCDLTATRTAGFLSAKKVVIVVGSNKLVKTHEDAAKRTNEFSWQLESARSRVVYKVPGSFIGSSLTINGGNPYAPGKYHFVIVKDLLGF
jgi:CheY-like chemotaxis protein